MTFIPKFALYKIFKLSIIRQYENKIVQALLFLSRRLDLKFSELWENTHLIDLSEVLDKDEGLLQPHPLLSQLAQQQLPQPQQKRMIGITKHDCKDLLYIQINRTQLQRSILQHKMF
jgi:hypothetical protein